MKRKFTTFTLIGFLIFLLIPITAFAASKNSTSNLSYVIKAIGPNVKDGYFNLNVQTNKTYDLPIEIANYQNKPIILDISGLNAITSDYGGIQYVSLIEDDTAFTDKNYEMANQITRPIKVTLNPEQTKIIHFTVNTRNLKGQELGGLSFTKDKSSTVQKEKKGQSSFNIENQVENVIAVQLNYPIAEATHISVNKPSLMTNPTGAYLVMNIANDNATITKNVNVTYSVLKNNVVQFAGNIKSFKMAPKSAIGYPVQWKEGSFESGTYQLKIHLTNNEGINIDKTFTFNIPSSTVKQYNNIAVPSPISKANKKIQILYTVIFVLAIILVFLFIQNQKNKKRTSENKH